MSSGVPPVVRLANEIGRQFEHLPLEVAADRVAAHIRSFWEPRMRVELLDAPDGLLDPVPLAARNVLREEAVAALKADRLN